MGRTHSDCQFGQSLLVFGWHNITRIMVEDVQHTCCVLLRSVGNGSKPQPTSGLWADYSTSHPLERAGFEPTISGGMNPSGNQTASLSLLRFDRSDRGLIQIWISFFELRESLGQGVCITRPSLPERCESECEGKHRNSFRSWFPRSAIR